jgi:hypothetical protein
VKSAIAIARIITRHAPWKRLYVVPVRISQTPMYQLCLQVKSRNGIMLKHVQNTQPFTESQLTMIKQYLGERCVIDQRLHSENRMYASFEEAQPALDAGLRVRIAVEPFAIDPSLLQLALDLQTRDRLEEWKQRERNR